MLLKFATIITSLYFFLFLSSPVSAALVSIDNEGEVIWNVLPAQDEFFTSEPDSLQVTNIAQASNASKNSQVTLKNTSGKVEIRVNDGNENKIADITNYQEEVLEIEQREAPSKISISVSESGFVIKERNVSAYTSFPINIDPEQKKISVETASGSQYVSVLPSDALLQLIQGNVIDVIDDGNLILNDNEIGEVQYTVNGKRTLNILNVFQYEIPISANVSASTGEVLSVEQPVWLPIATFLFT